MWLPILARNPLLFIIYINDLPDGLISLAKLFADEISLFSKVTAGKLSNDLQKITMWAL